MVGLDSRTYATAHEFLSAPRPDRPGCILVDIRLPDMNGLDFQVRLTQLGVGVPVVIMTGYGDVPMSVQAMKRGAGISSQAVPRSGLARRGADRRRTRSPSAGSRRRNVTDATAFRNVVRARKTSHAPCNVRKDEQASRGRSGYKRDNCEIDRGAAMRKMNARTLPDLVRMVEALIPTRT